MGEPNAPSGASIAAIHFERTPLMPRAAVQLVDHPTVYLLQRDAVRLKVGEWMPPDTLQDLQRRYRNRAAYLQAVRFLGARDRSSKEVEDHLRGKGWEAAVCAQALAKLSHEGYVDDVRFAAQWVAQRCRSAPRSRLAVTLELKRKGVAPATIQAAVAAMDEDALALACARRKRRQWQRYTTEERRRRIVVFLQRKGFPYEACRQAAEKLLAQTAGD